VSSRAARKASAHRAVVEGLQLAQIGCCVEQLSKLLAGAATKLSTRRIVSVIGEIRMCDVAGPSRKSAEEVKLVRRQADCQRPETTKAELRCPTPVS
jgi:hypothetical protein